MPKQPIFDYTLLAAFINGVNRGVERQISDRIRRREKQAWREEFERRSV